MQIEYLNTEIQELKAKLEEKENSSGLGNNIKDDNESKEVIEEYESKINFLNQQINYYQNTLNDYKNKIKENEIQIEKLKNKIVNNIDNKNNEYKKENLNVAKYNFFILSNKNINIDNTLNNNKVMTLDQYNDILKKLEILQHENISLKENRINKYKNKNKNKKINNEMKIKDYINKNIKISNLNKNKKINKDEKDINNDDSMNINYDQSSLEISTNKKKINEKEDESEESESNEESDENSNEENEESNDNDDSNYDINLIIKELNETKKQNKQIQNMLNNIKNALKNFFNNIIIPGKEEEIKNVLKITGFKDNEIINIIHRK